VNILGPAIEDLNGRGGRWGERVIYTGDEHHDSVLAVDLGGDGDLDFVSIAWRHRKVLFC